MADVHRIISMIDSTFGYFESLGNKWHKDSDGVLAVKEVRDIMVQDLQELSGDAEKGPNRFPL